MIGGERVIGVIPARGGSRAIPLKSIAPLGGVSLLERAVALAKRVSAIDRIIISTDSEVIGDVARRAGAEVYPRPANLATDTALVIDALRDLIRRLAAEGERARFMVLLEATAPFRQETDVEECLARLVRGADSVATFTRAATPPAKAWTIQDDHPEPYIDGADPWLPRQSTPEAWELNGAVYAFDLTKLPAVGRSILFGRSAAVVMPRSRSVDINTDLDLKVAEFLLERNLNAQPS